MKPEQDEIVAELHRYRKQRQEEFGNDTAAMVAATILEQKKLEAEGWTVIPAPARPKLAPQVQSSASQG